MRILPASLALMSALAVAPAAAEDWSALVIGNPSPNAPTAFADAFHVADSLENSGIGSVVLRRELGADEMASAFEELAGADRVLVYFVGAIGTQASSPVLMGQGGGDARAALTPILQKLAVGGATEVALLIEDCAGGSGMAGRVAIPEIPEGLSLFMAASAGPEGECPSGEARLTDLLTTGRATTLQDALASVWVGSSGIAPVAMANAAVSSTPIIADEVTVISTVSDDVIMLTTTIEPVTSSNVVSGVEPVSTGSDVGVIDDNTVIFVAPPSSQLAALPIQAGLPEPSIIVGIIAGEEASFAVVDDDTSGVDSNEITYDNLEARQALRTENPDLYQTLVNGGAFDPPDVELARALQSELSRMGCYRSGIDGIWGNGSRSSVDRYFEEAGGTPVNREPTTDLFRQIILSEDVDCPAPPAPVAQAPARQPSAQRQPSAPARQPARQPAPARQPTPAPAPAPAPSTNSGGLGGANLGAGVFR